MVRDATSGQWWRTAAARSESTLTPVAVNVAPRGPATTCHHVAGSVPDGRASAVLKVKPQTLKSRLHRGRLILRQHMGEFAGALTLHEREIH